MHLCYLQPQVRICALSPTLLPLPSTTERRDLDPAVFEEQQRKIHRKYHVVSTCPPHPQ